MHLKNRGNEYAKNCEGFDKTPKTVFAALAYSLALRLAGNDSHEDALEILRDEWESLNTAGIVPQKPTKKNTTP